MNQNAHIPLVTVAIPLYRSKRFLRVIEENIEALNNDDVEIIVSDRHGNDDAIQLLKTRFAGDARVRFVERHDGANWVQHFNFLFKMSRGKYFRFTPHDDSFPRGSLAPLVAAMEANDDIIVAYGLTDAVHLDSADPQPKLRPAKHPTRDGEPWSLDIALDFFWRGYCDGALKGLIRRATVVEAGAFMRQTHQLVFPERAWLFCLALLGRFCIVPESSSVKRYYSDSTHASWVRQPKHVTSAAATMLCYLWSHHESRRGRVWGSVHVVAHAVKRMAKMSGGKPAKFWRMVEEHDWLSQLRQKASGDGISSR